MPPLASAKGAASSKTPSLKKRWGLGSALNVFEYHNMKINWWGFVGLLLVVHTAQAQTVLNTIHAISSHQETGYGRAQRPIVGSTGIADTAGINRRQNVLSTADDSFDAFFACGQIVKVPLTSTLAVRGITLGDVCALSNEAKSEVYSVGGKQGSLMDFLVLNSRLALSSAPQTMNRISRDIDLVAGNATLKLTWVITRTRPDGLAKAVLMAGDETVCVIGASNLPTSSTASRAPTKARYQLTQTSSDGVELTAQIAQTGCGKRAGFRLTLRVNQDFLGEPLF